MAQESPKNSAAEIPVTSNGEVDDAHEHGYNRSLNNNCFERMISPRMLRGKHMA